MADAYSAIQALQAQIRQVRTVPASTQTASWTLHDLDGSATVTDTTGTTGAWTTWRIPGVPAGATHVKLECWSVQNEPDGVDTLSLLNIRSNNTGTTLIGCAGRAAGNADSTGSAMQGDFPAANDGSIQYNASSDFLHWQIRAIGYWM